MLNSLDYPFTPDTIIIPKNIMTGRVDLFIKVQELFKTVRDITEIEKTHFYLEITYDISTIDQQIKLLTDLKDLIKTNKE